MSGAIGAGRHYRRDLPERRVGAMPPTPAAPAIRMAGLTKSYGPVEAVRGIDLGVAPGEVVALLGPNGAGKSTTIDMLLGLSRPDRGDIRVFGLPPADAVAAGQVGAMLQTGGLVRDLKVRELLAMVASLYPSPLDVRDVLARAGLEEVAGRRTQHLSGGQAQRVRFAMALVSDPGLLVLDEPTAALDVGARQAFWAAMRSMDGDARTVLFATHHLEEADLYADRVVLVAQGRVVADGPTTEVKAMVGGRIVRCTLPAADADHLRALPGVAAVEVHGDVVTLSCTDADRALRALLDGHPDARDLEVRGAGLEEAFLELTADPATR
jgi:ABC-2 type transport system ATP-binding protein